VVLRTALSSSTTRIRAPPLAAPLRPASFFFAAVCTLVWPTRNMPSSTWLGPGNTALLGPEMRPETGLDVMEMVANSSSDRRQVGRQKDRQRSSVTHGSKPLAGIDGRSARVRRFESNISDLGGETLQCRQRHRLTCPCLNRPAGAARSQVRPGGRGEVIAR
jgi:hypothetical protein